MDTNAATNDAGAVGGTLVPHEGAGTLDAAQSAMTGGSAQLRFNPQYERFNKSLRRSLEVSLNFLQKTNAHAYALLAVLTMLPGGATKADLDAIWQPQDMVSSTADGNACSWPQLMQVLTQPPSQGASPAGQWLVQKRDMPLVGRLLHDLLASLEHQLQIVPLVRHAQGSKRLP